MINLNGEFGSRRNIVGAIQLLVKASEKSSGTCPEAPYTLGLLLLNEYPSTTLPRYFFIYINSVCYFYAKCIYVYIVKWSRLMEEHLQL